MGDILSQDEVDSLLQGISSGEIETEPEEEVSEDGVALYDFANQDRVIRGRMPTLEVVNKRLARMFSSSLSATMRGAADISVRDTNMIKFSEFQSSIPVPANIHMFKMEPLRGHALLVVDTPLVFQLIEYYFGGTPGGALKVEGRDFTRIENQIIRKVVGIFLKDFDDAWAPIYPIKPVYVRSEMNPQFAVIGLPIDLMIIVRFQVELETTEGGMTLAIPYSMLEPIRDKLYSGFQSDNLEADASWRKRVESQVKEVLVEICVELGTAVITAERLMSLRKGDVISLDQFADEPLTAKIQGVPKIAGKAGVVKGSKAIAVEGRITMD
ncbi:flagellar motor switch protein FliM [Desulfatibacillum aliphaticivorans]|uniref:flagellar motor switch protein FliM n=1 Tax=Desulfatibacillum aliphaticivorans TaxID=218208 RepID=UPI000422C389|nr:flagellar motor switch protein FliM [Desulfatibacillum aliphaticivorans]